MITQLTRLDAAILAAFDQWLKAHPQGGIFEYHGYKLQVYPKVTPKTSKN